MKLVFEKSAKNRQGLKLPESDVPVSGKIDSRFCREEDASLPEMSELDVVRHYTLMSQRNFSVDTQFYPLGSCTMKYNPKFTEALAAVSGFAQLHPLLPQIKGGEQWTQGALEVLYELERLFCEMTGFSAFTLQPLAGAHGELTGIMLMAAYHKAKGNDKKYIIVPDSAHGTNPASAAVAGYDTISVPTNSQGVMDLVALEKVITDQVAGLMVTSPNTLGIFNSDIDKISSMIHKVDGLMYYDGANLNAVLGRCRPGDLGFDVMHINTHKTFTTPHGGGGPGAGPVGVNEKLEPFLPISRVVKNKKGGYELSYDFPDSIGYISTFYGNFGLLLRAYAYILMLGKEGIKQTADHAVLNANYIKEKLKDVYRIAYDRICMHECVFTAANQAERGVHAVDIAKYLIDQQFHPPTVYFPISVKEAIMIEPTETESKETMDEFIKAMKDADELSRTNPESFRDRPHTSPITRPDEVKAARDIRTSFFAK